MREVGVWVQELDGGEILFSCLEQKARLFEGRASHPFSSNVSPARMVGSRIFHTWVASMNVERRIVIT
jgi:hypothetical protein